MPAVLSVVANRVPKTPHPSARPQSLHVISLGSCLFLFDFKKKLDQTYFPRKLAYPLQNRSWKTIYLLKWSLFRCHLNFFGWSNSPERYGQGKVYISLLACQHAHILFQPTCGSPTAQPTKIHGCDPPIAFGEPVRSSKYLAPVH